jgi:cellulose synthase/poly-beta-1,6-N-acetylglucosamine synthase-like glycosyltransferase
MDLFFYPLLTVYAIVLVALFVYGLNFYYLAYLTVKHRAPDPETPKLSEYPRVTVQLPIFNERYVASRLIDSVCQLDWPWDKLEIQVLDDSTDETVGIVATAVRRYRMQGLNIVHLHREDREGYKAGALAAGLKEAEGAFIAIFDADFLPPPRFLRDTVPHFADRELGFVQTRWGHLNADYSFFTKLQALSIDGHFMVEQYARQRAGFMMNFNGTAGVWRREAIDDAGGWRADTLTEDLDLSYRAQLAGWKPGYLRDVVTPAELPVMVNAYRRQQYRWAQGSIECAIRLIPRLWKAPLDRMVKLQGVLHLTGYWISVLMTVLSVLYPLVLVFFETHPQLVSLFGLALLFSFTALAPTTYFALAQRELGRTWWRHLPAILFLSVLGSGMMISNVQAIAQAFTRRSAVFERTPKFGVVGNRHQWDKKTYSVKVSPRIMLEVAMLLLNAHTVRSALAKGHYVIAFYAGIFASGLMFLISMTAWQAVRPGSGIRGSAVKKRTAKSSSEAA